MISCNSWFKHRECILYGVEQSNRRWAPRVCFLWEKKLKPLLFGALTIVILVNLLSHGHVSEHSKASPVVVRRLVLCWICGLGWDGGVTDLCASFLRDDLREIRIFFLIFIVHIFIFSFMVFTLCFLTLYLKIMFCW